MGVFRKQKQASSGDWIKPREMMTPGPGGPDGRGGRPVPARLRRVGGGDGEWLRGALRLAPGSLLWEPDQGVNATPVELATAAVLAAPAQSRRGQATVTNLRTPMGEFQLELDPVLFEMSQELVAEEAARRAGPPADPGGFFPPAG